MFQYVAVKLTLALDTTLPFSNASTTKLYVPLFCERLKLTTWVASVDCPPRLNCTHCPGDEKAQPANPTGV
jgi:hypothetical protein